MAYSVRGMAMMRSGERRGERQSAEEAPEGASGWECLLRESREQRRRPLCLSLIVSSVLLLGAGHALAGCASQRRSVTTSTYEVEDESGDATGSGRAPARKVVEREETTEESGTSCGGVLSCTVDGVGWVLALPFRLVGGIIGFIF